MNIRLINAIDQPSNLHHHGSNVSPLNNGNNVFVDLMPEQIFDQQIVFPPGHPPFQVAEIDGQPIEFVGRQDVVNLPVQSTVKILIPFTNPVIVGKLVYHCHIVSHEDNGMMAVIEVVDPQAGGDPQASHSAGQTGASPHRH
jgi:Multicopper oxidase